MTAFEKIIKAIEPFGFPYTPGVYKGEEKHWFTFNYVDDRGNLYADDEPQSVLATVQVHFFMPYNEDFVRIKNKIKCDFPAGIYFSGDRDFKRHRPADQTFGV